MNHFTETSTTSYGQNIANSFKGIFVGLIFLIGSIVLLTYNENRSINQTEALEEMQSKIITLSDTKYDSMYEQKPVLLQGEVIPKKPLKDTLFEVDYDGLILQRDVSMYQWEETETTENEDQVGGSTKTTTTYDYALTWSSTAIDSSSFKYPTNHENPSMAYTKERFSTDADMGEFYLADNIVANFDAIEDSSILEQLPKTINNTTNYKSFLYFGENPEKPNLGDMKITYRVAPKGLYSVAGMVHGKSIVPYVTQNDRHFVFVRYGTVSADQIFQEEFQSNTILTWALRGAGLLFMFFGFVMMMGLLSTLANVLPMLGSLIGGATSLVALVLTLLLGSLVIAIAWFGSRPLLSLSIVGIGIVLVWAIKQFKKEQPLKSEQANESTTNTTPPPREKGENR